MALNPNDFFWITMLTVISGIAGVMQPRVGFIALTVCWGMWALGQAGILGGT